MSDRYQRIVDLLVQENARDPAFSSLVAALQAMAQHVVTLADRHSQLAAVLAGTVSNPLHRAQLISGILDRVADDAHLSQADQVAARDRLLRLDESLAQARRALALMDRTTDYAERLLAAHGLTVEDA